MFNSVVENYWGMSYIFKVQVSENYRCMARETHWGRSYLHPTAQVSRLRTAALGQGLLGNDERVFTGRRQESVGGVYRAWQSAAVPHWGLCNIHDLITNCLLLVEEGRPKRWPQTRKWGQSFRWKIEFEEGAMWLEKIVTGQKEGNVH